MNTLIAFATQWGSKYGGINSFNADFLSAFGFAYPKSVRVICVVPFYDKEALEETSEANVTLVSLPTAANAKTLDSEHGSEAIEQLSRLQIAFDPERTMWLGHDRITGEAAIQAAQVTGGRSAVIHHMSYDHYESYAESSESAYLKTQKQRKIFADADVILAVGPLLRNAARDLVQDSKPVCTLIPGLAQIDVRSAPSTFVAFLSGRLSSDAARIKQGQLGIAAFAQAEREAIDNGMPDALCQHPKLLIRGVDFENEIGRASTPGDPERDLKRFAEKYAEKMINLQALPYTNDREELFAELAGASVALMPSWHEGFGLVAWEAIAAGVPLIVSKNSGVYRLIEDQEPGAEVGYVYALEVRGKVDDPYFRPEDLTETVAALNEVAKNPGRARLKASRLRNLLGDYTWVRCAEQAATCFGWSLEKGFLPSAPATTPSPNEPSTETIGVREESSPLKIPAPQWRRDAGRAESQLLRAEEALLPFDRAREPEVDELNKWLDDNQLLRSLRLITGEGGQGKTRLALELCKRRSESGWKSGFLDSAIPASDMAITWQGLSELNQPLLIVIDYAETRQPVVLALIQAALLKPSTKPTRILLLARDGGEWWDNLPGENPNCEGFLTGPATAGPFRLAPLYATNPDRQLAFSTALNAFAAALNVKAPKVRVELAGEHFERPLYVQMAALLALHGEKPVTAEGVTKALLNHERRYWRALLAHFNWSEPERRAEQLLALATLGGGFRIARDARKLWDEVGEFDTSNSDFNSFFRELASLYPGTQGLEALRPDLLGEALVAQAALRPEGEALLNAVVSDSATQMVRRNALTVIARLSTHRMDLDETIIEMLVRNPGQCWRDLVAVCTETVSRLPELMEDAFGRSVTTNRTKIGGMLTQVLRNYSVQFARLRSLVFGYVAETSRRRFEQKPGDLQRITDYARDLILYAEAQKDNGELERAQEIGAQSVELYRRLTSRNRDKFESDLSEALDCYAGYLWRLDRAEESLKYVKEGLDIVRRLAQKNPGRYEQHYGVSLENYGTSLSKLGKYEEALKYSEEALKISERQAAKNDDFSLSDYGKSLNNYGFKLGVVGRHEEAIEYTRQALEIRERLFKKNADRFEPDYAASLENYAGALSDLGRDEEARQYAQKGQKAFEELSQKNADRFKPSYAESLHAYATYSLRTERNEEAVEYAHQAVEIVRQMTEKNADRFESDYASSCSNYAEMLGSVGRYEEAIEYSQKALEICDRLMTKDADRFEYRLAATLQRYANDLNDLGRTDEAFAYAREALKNYEALNVKNPQRFAGNLFLTRCLTHFLAWLRGEGSELDSVNKTNLLESTPNYEHPLMLLCFSFLEGCLATEAAACLNAMESVLSYWKDLTVPDKRAGEEYWFCAVSYCAHANSEEKPQEWTERWERYSSQRSGRLPAWLLQVAQRLGFEWPGPGHSK